MILSNFPDGLFTFALSIKLLLNFYTSYYHIIYIIITNSYSFLVTSYYNTSNLLQKYSASILALSAVGIAIIRVGSTYPNYLLTD